MKDSMKLNKYFPVGERFKSRNLVWKGGGVRELNYFLEQHNNM